MNKNIVALKRITDHLMLKSRRYDGNGISVGAILIPRQYAGVLQQMKDVSCGSEIRTLGFKKVSEIPGLEDYFLIHLSTSSAAVFLNNMISPTVMDFLQVSGGAFFGGVRLYDSELDYPFSLYRDIKPNAKFRFGELFAGIGGFRIGLESIGGTCVYASEVDEAAKATYSLNFGSNELFGDIGDVYPEDLPEIDILTAGFPCQPFSVRGEQKGLSDPKGRLFYELVRVLSVQKPKAFLFENVASLVTHGGGRRNKRSESIDTLVVGPCFAMMLQAFEQCGYQVAWRIVNSRHWLPQMRERVFIVGFRADLRAPPMDWDFSAYSRVTLGTRVRDVLEDPSCAEVQAASLSACQWAKVDSEDFKRKANRWGVCHKDGEKAGDGSTASSSPVDNARHTHWTEIRLDGKAPTITSNYRNAGSFSSKYIFEERDGTRRATPRFLTKRECARVMGFPESFLIPPADNHRFYHQIGNAVCPPVISAIGEKMLSILEAL